jgi:sugar lactone lactonase YvrE
VASEAQAQPSPPALRLHKKHALLLMLLLLLGTSLLWANYLLKRRPIGNLPGAGAILKTVPPRYLFSITGTGQPLAVAVSQSDDRIYVGESGGERLIRVFDRAGNPMRAFAPPDSSPGKRMPMGIAVSRTGKVFVADRMRGAIDTYDADGVYLGPFVPEGVGTWLPLGVALDDEDSLYVTDTSTGYHRVLVFRANGSLKLAMGKEGEGNGELSFPYAAAIDGRYNVFVSDSNNGRITVFNRDGTALGAMAAGTEKGSLGLPRGIAFDTQGRLHVADTSTHGVNVYDVTATPPQFLYSFGDIGIGDGEFRFPSGLATDQTGRVYVADRENNRVQVWTY